jgi:putative transposase
MRTDQGPEFTSQVMDRWAHGRRIDLKLIAVGNAMQNAYIESFNGKLLDECFNEHYIDDLAHARAVTGVSRRNYNENRLQRAIGRIPPAELALPHRRHAADAATREIV